MFTPSLSPPLLITFFLSSLPFSLSILMTSLPVQAFLHVNQFLSKMTTLESMNRFVSPINPAVFPHLTVVLLGIGIFFMAWFFVYEVTSTKFSRDIYKELLVSLFASVFMGFGVLFLLLWVGIYV
ncbi:transmembrane protein 258 [Octopus sinensis]|uniref:Dolichyl-diphosphooligosaccharide-protein glycosyltransferase subunit TMEM258 n=1 Tax=Octopus sinensis TaxID=2607531 RepID=A0A6P7TIT0_9MOLL|nr:transmembrane protein 258 [Octopus sinensis]